MRRLAPPAPVPRGRVKLPAALLAGASAVALVTAGTMLASTSGAATGFSVTYTVTSQWPGGFVANVDITNTGSAVSSWTVGWTFGDSGQKVSSAWNTTLQQNGTSVQATNAGYNGSLPSGARTSFGFQGTFTSANPVPSSFTVNGSGSGGGTTTTRTSTTKTSTTKTRTTTTKTTTTTTRTSTTSSSGGGGSPSTSWPSASGSVKVGSTISVSGTFDGGMKRYYGIGDGGQSESQDPMFKLSDGATIKNVVIGSPAGDGIHCTGRCTIQNVWWEDVGEDAATFKGTSGDSYVIGGGAKSASDKVFQHNGSGTVHISGFYAASIGKLYRACGNCSSSYQRHVRVDNVLLDSAKYVVGINSNWGDTATLSRITLVNGSKTHVCAKYKGVSKGSEPSYLGDGWNDGNCKVSQSDVTYR